MKMFSTRPAIGLDDEKEFESLLSLACDVCLPESMESAPGSDATEQERMGNKDWSHVNPLIQNTLNKVTSRILPPHRKRFLECLCLRGNVSLLEIICMHGQERKKNYVQYKLKGYFTDCLKITDLLKYAIENQCSPEIVRCISHKVYGKVHGLCNGTQYIDPVQNRNMHRQQPYLLECFKAAIKSRYKSALLVMLGGDIYHCIRLMRWTVFKEKKEFYEAYTMIIEKIADIISSWIKDEKQSFKGYVEILLKQGIEKDMMKMEKEDLLFQLEFLEKEFVNKSHFTKKELIEDLKNLGKDKGELRLKRTVVGALISTLFFKHQDEMTKLINGEPFTVKPEPQDNHMRKEMQCELNKIISNRENINKSILRLIKTLNAGSHLSNKWFFRIFLSKVLNDTEALVKLRAVCIAVCQSTMQELVEDLEVDEEVMNILNFFGVKRLQECKVSMNVDLLGVLEALKKVLGELEKSRKLFQVQKLFLVLVQLLDALQEGDLVIKQTPILSHTLKLLHASSNAGQRFIIAPLHLLAMVLEEQVNCQEYCTTKQEILTLLRYLDKICVTQMQQHACNIPIASSTPGPNFLPEACSSVINPPQSSKGSGFPNDGFLHTFDDMSVGDISVFATQISDNSSDSTNQNIIELSHSIYRRGDRCMDSGVSDQQYIERKMRLERDESSGWRRV